jgi:hypothetical protein
MELCTYGVNERYQLGHRREVGSGFMTELGVWACHAQKRLR